MHAAIPLTDGGPAGPTQPVRPVNHCAASVVLHLWRVSPRASLAVHVAPCRERLDLKADRPAADQPVHDGDGRAAVPHGDLPFDHDLADPPAPARKSVVEVEVLEQLVPGRRDCPARPLVHTQPDPRAAGQDEHWVQACQAEVPACRYP